MAKIKVSEEKLCEMVSEHFKHGDIYPEVPCNGGYIDLVVVDKPLIIGIEVKNSLSMQLLSQAYDRLGRVHILYVATPVSPSAFMKKFLEFHGIGCLVINQYSGEIYERVVPRIFRKIRAVEVAEYMKQSKAGTQHIRVTSFQQFIKDLERQLSFKPDGMTYQELFEGRQHTHYNTLKSYKANIYQYIRGGVIKGMVTDNGKVYLQKDKAA